MIPKEIIIIFTVSSKIPSKLITDKICYQDFALKPVLSVEC